MASSETHEFQAETSRLLHLVVNSLYTTKDIFLRELISNASDALDRLRFETIRNPDLVPESHEYAIRLEPDAGSRTLTVHDTGVGMSREEVVDNIGTIARSGTREVLERVAEAGDSDAMSRLIGQFGVGFYSAFMVADRIVVVTRRPGDAVATRWESGGEGRYTVSETVRDRPGTSITLHLRPVDEEAGLHDYTSPRILEGIVRRYSDFITWPVVLVGTDDEGNPSERTLNAMKPIWTRPPGEVEDEELHEFYRHVSHDWGTPLESLSLRAEGRTEYRALLFIPERAPLDLGTGAVSYGLQLYAKQVMVMERCEEVLEPWLRFVKGVVDAADLPLNVSREMLQQDRHLHQIRRWITGRVLKTLGEMRDDRPDDYRRFWSEFGRILKEGYLAGSEEHRARLDELLLFATTREPEGLRSLRQVVDDMAEGQEAILYLTGESRRAVESSPLLEAVRERGWEVLLLTDPVDELMVQTLTGYDGRPLRSVAAADLDLQEEKVEDEGVGEAPDPELSGLLERLGELLADHVTEVRLSSRLTESPACVVAPGHGLSPQLERILREAGQEVPPQKRILELNPRHAAVARLRRMSEADTDAGELADAAYLLFGSAMLAEGSEVPDPARFQRLVGDLLGGGT